MKSELNFKHKIDEFPFEEKKENLRLAVLQRNTKARYAALVKQREIARIEAGYIEDKSKRCKYVFAFADRYRAVLDKECRKFYKKNPKQFRREKGMHLFVGMIAAGVSPVLIMLGYKIAFNMGGGLGHIMGGLILATMGCSFAISSAALIGRALVMTWKGIEGCHVHPADFLCEFKNDKNLKELWFNEKNKEMRVSQKSYKNKEKALQKINAYHETRNWLQQWSEGDLSRLRKVEWLALCGIAKKYGKYLTPVDSNDGVTGSDPFLTICGLERED